MENNGCFDLPDPRDYELDEVLGADIPTVTLPKYTVYNQSADLKTRMGCTRYGLGVPANIQNIMEYEKVGEKYEEIDPKIYRLKTLEKFPNREGFGDSLQNALNQFKEEGIIDGYVKIRTVEQAEMVIDKGHQIYTGLAGVNRSETRDSGILTRNPQSTMGHCIFIKGYDDKHFIIQNSYGEKRGPFGDGTFKMLKTDRDKLFTKYMIIDKETITPLRKKKLAEAIIKNIDEIVELSENETVIKELVEAKVILKKHGF